MVLQRSREFKAVEHAVENGEAPGSPRLHAFAPDSQHATLYGSCAAQPLKQRGQALP